MNSQLFRNYSKYLLTVREKRSKIVFRKYSKYCGVISMGFAETFKALSDPVRRDILTLLKQNRLSAGEIGSNFNMTGATISYHLNVLKKAELVYEQREKNYIYYELNASVLEEILMWLSDLKGEKDYEVVEGK